jgi:hypothetical protein
LKVRFLASYALKNAQHGASRAPLAPLRSPQGNHFMFPSTVHLPLLDDRISFLVSEDVSAWTDDLQ